MPRSIRETQIGFLRIDVGLNRTILDALHAIVEETACGQRRGRFCFARRAPRGRLRSFTSNCKAADTLRPKGEIPSCALDLAHYSSSGATTADPKAFVMRWLRTPTCY